MATVTTPLLDVTLDTTPVVRSSCRKTSESSNTSGNFLAPGPYTTTSSNSRRQSRSNSSPKRKFSFPVSLHASSLLTESNTLSARSIRRLSNVSDVVTRKLSTIGWKNVIPAQDIITQGKCLVSQYIRCRLKRAGLFNKKLGLQRLRSIVGTPSILVVQEVFPALFAAGEELERLHPRTYTNVARQISSAPGSDLQNPETGPILLAAVARTLLKNNQINWGKIISMFAVCGGLSVDMVRQGQQEHLGKLIEGFGDVIEDELVTFISENGGWPALACKMRPELNKFNIVDALIVFILFVIIISIFYFLISQFIYPKFMGLKF